MISAMALLICTVTISLASETAIRQEMSLRKTAAPVRNRHREAMTSKSDLPTATFVLSVCALYKVLGNFDTKSSFREVEQDIVNNSSKSMDGWSFTIKATDNNATIEAVYNLNPTPVDPLKYRKTLLFIRGFAKGRNMPNTLKALALAERLHEGQTRKSGDPFVIHPLRVASYLICLKFIDDYACAASLLHEVFKHCGFDRESSELVEKYGLDEEVLDLIRLVSKPDTMSLEDYYKGLKTNHKALIIKLSNRANTCTGLSGYTAKEKNAYIEENNNFIYPLCTYGKAYFPDYSDQIVNMKNHIKSVCRIVEAITKEEVIDEKE